MNYLISNFLPDQNRLKYFSRDKQKINHTKEFNIWADDLIRQEKEHYYFVDGYFYDLTDGLSKKERIANTVEEIFNNWPISDNFTGSFAVSILKESKLVIANDPIGFYPLYYYLEKDNEKIVVSNSLFWIAEYIDKPSFDEVGIGQILLCNESLNLGSRTILKNVKRLLPGEKIIYNNKEKRLERIFDNSLFKINPKYRPTKEGVTNFWKDTKREMELISEENNQLYLALSGGMDSRLVLGYIPQKIDLNCFTYGNDDQYEVKVASKLAKIKKAKFQYFYDPEKYFPTKKTLSNYVLLKKGHIRLPNWFEILENVQGDHKSYFMLGDMCESLPGRNIGRYNIRKYKLRNYITGVSKNNFIQNTPENFENWREAKKEKIKSIFKIKTYNQLKLNIDYEVFIQETIKDLNELINRIKAHNIPYVELLDELYAWYTHSRIPMSDQILLCNTKFKAIAPTMSTRFLRITSSIAPEYRLYYKFMNKLFKTIPELKRLNKVPTAQAPLVNRNYPSLFSMAMWAIRHYIDQKLIKRMIKKRNPKLRYRLFKSLHWPEIYQQPGVKENYSSYFDPVSKYAEGLQPKYIKLLDKRINLEVWPLANYDLISFASANMLFLHISDIIESKQNL